MEDTLVATDGKHTVHVMQDFTSSLSVCWIVGTVCHTVQSTSKLLTPSRISLKRSVPNRWISSWTTSLLNSWLPVNFAVTLLDFYNGGNASGAATPGEIPGAIYYQRQDQELGPIHRDILERRGTRNKNTSRSTGCQWLSPVTYR